MTTDRNRHRPSNAPPRLVRLQAEAATLAKIGGWECDLETERLTWTDGVYDLFDLPRGSVLQRSMIVDLYEDKSRRHMEMLRAAAIRNATGFTLDARIETRRGATRWMRLTADVACADGRPVRLFGAKQDITQDKILLDRLRQRADCDPLTGLANRGLFESRLDALSRTPSGEDRIAALALVDLDRFKAINDTLGHLAGDACLRETATRLRSAFGDALLIARIGGDEFAVLLRAPLGRLRIAHMLERARRLLCRPVAWNDTSIDLGASIGVSLQGPLGRTPATVFAEADAALYAAKAAGRGAVRIHGDDGVVDPGWRDSATGVRRRG